MRILHLSSTNSLRYCPSVSAPPSPCTPSLVSSFSFLAVIYIAWCFFFFFSCLLPVLSRYASAFSHSFFSLYRLTPMSHPYLSCPLFSLRPHPSITLSQLTLPHLLFLSTPLMLPNSSCLVFRHCPFLLFHHHRLILSTLYPPLIPHTPSLPPSFLPSFLPHPSLPPSALFVPWGGQ